MADVKDVSASIASALEEVGVNGTLDVQMEGDRAEKPLGHPAGDELAVTVVLVPAEAGSCTQEGPAETESHPS